MLTMQYPLLHWFICTQNMCNEHILQMFYKLYFCEPRLTLKLVLKTGTKAVSKPLVIVHRTTVKWNYFNVKIAFKHQESQNITL